MSSIFKATVRRSGTSQVVTIPKQVAEGLNLANGTIINVEIRKVGEAEDDA